MALCLALLSISHSNAQTIDYVTGNLINFSGSPTSTTSNWNNGVYVNQLGCFGGNTPGNCGPYPSVRTDGNINFSYGLVDLNQVFNVANAVAGATSPVTVTGFNFSFRAKNGNGWDDGRIDQLSAYVQLHGPTHNLLENYNYNLTSKYDWSNFSYTEKFATPHPLSSVATAQVGFIGKDNNYWAGPYGPEIQNVSFSLKYSVNPCVTNPGYMPSCPGFNNVITSSNLVPNPGAQASWGGGINNSFAIQTALQNSGSGLIVHGFDYGYRVNATQSYCEAEFIICWSWHSGGSVQVNAGITNAKGQNIYSVTRNYNESGYSDENFHYRFPTSTNQMMLGNFNFTASTSGDAWVGNMYSRMVYSQDPCVNNPNYTPSCINKVAPTYTAPSITNSSASKEATSTGAVVINVGGAQISSTGVISAPDGIPQAIKDVQAVAQQSQTSATSSQAAEGSSTQQQQQSSRSAPSLSSIMNMVNQAQANDRATQAMAVQNANRIAATSSAQAQEQAMSIVDTLNAMSAESSQASQINETQTSSQSFALIPQQSSMSSTLQLQSPTVMPLQNLMSISSQLQSTNTAPTMASSEQMYQAPVSTASMTVQTPMIETNVTAPVSFSLASTYVANRNPSIYNEQQLSSMLSINQPVAETTPVQQTKLETKPLDAETPIIPVMSSTTRGSSVTEIAETKANVESAQNEQGAEPVKKNVQSNELAGGVDIAALATQPKGFDVYATTILKDSAFYAPKDIYGNQKTIDNARALRSLSSDRLHQEMIDLQYRR